MQSLRRYKHKWRKWQTLTIVQHLLIVLMASHQLSKPMSPHLQEQKKAKSKKSNEKMMRIPKIYGKANGIDF